MGVKDILRVLDPQRLQAIAGEVSEAVGHLRTALTTILANQHAIAARLDRIEAALRIREQGDG